MPPDSKHNTFPIILCDSQKDLEVPHNLHMEKLEDWYILYQDRSTSGIFSQIQESYLQSSLMTRLDSHFPWFPWFLSYTSGCLYPHDSLISVLISHSDLIMIQVIPSFRICKPLIYKTAIWKTALSTFLGLGWPDFSVPTLLNPLISFPPFPAAPKGPQCCEVRRTTEVNLRFILRMDLRRRTSNKGKAPKMNTFRKLRKVTELNNGK